MIARTLGVVDVTKASTGGIAAGHEESDIPPISVDGATSESLAPENGSGSDASSISVSTPSYFKETVVEESNMRLSGADMFSPYPSQPPSPSLSRRDLSLQTQLQPMTEIVGGRKRSGTTSSSASRSGESQFTIIDRDSGSEAENVQVRRRKGQQRDDEETP